MNRDISIIALFLEVQSSSWLELHLQLQELWIHLLPTDTRSACLHTEAHSSADAAIEDCNWIQSITQSPVMILNWHLLDNGKFLIVFFGIPNTFSLHQGPKRCNLSEWPMFLPVIETDCFLSKRWPPIWGLRSLEGRIFLPLFLWTKWLLIKFFSFGFSLSSWQSDKALPAYWLSL